MKKIFTLLFFLPFFTNVFSQACVPDAQHAGIPGIYPDVTNNLAIAYVGQVYSDVMTFVLPTDTFIYYPGVGGVTYTLNYQRVDSVKYIVSPGDTSGYLQDINFSYACNPSNCVLPGGASSCININGNPLSINEGIYQLIFYVTTNLYHPTLGVFNAPGLNIITGYKLIISGNSPPIDPCTNIISINGCGSENAQTFTGGGGYGYWANNSCGYSGLGAEQIYSFVAPVTGDYYIQAYGNASAIFQWKSNICDSSNWTCIGEVTISWGIGAPLSWIAGNTYYIQVAYPSSYSSNALTTFHFVCPLPISCTHCPAYDFSLTPTSSWQTHNSSIQPNTCKTYRFLTNSPINYYTFKTGCGDGATANFETYLAHYRYYNNQCDLLQVTDNECENNRSFIGLQGGDTYSYIKVYGSGSNSGNYTLAYSYTYTTGIEENEISITIFPNPANSEITVTGYTPAYLKLCNMLGQTVEEVNKSNNIYIGNLPQGLYVLQLFDDKGGLVKTEKVVKE